MTDLSASKCARPRLYRTYSGFSILNLENIFSKDDLSPVDDYRVLIVVKRYASLRRLLSSYISIISAKMAIINPTRDQ